MPKRWSIKKTMKELHVSERMAKAARKLKIEKGILTQPKNRQRKKPLENVKQKMEIFEDQEFSLICSGKKDCFHSSRWRKSSKAKLLASEQFERNVYCLSK